MYEQYGGHGRLEEKLENPNPCASKSNEPKTRHFFSLIPLLRFQAAPPNRFVPDNEDVLYIRH